MNRNKKQSAHGVYLWRVDLVAKHLHFGSSVWAVGVTWNNDAKNKDDDSFIEKCEGLTMAMQECVEAHPDYYGAISELEEEETNVVESEKEW